MTLLPRGTTILRYAHFGDGMTVKSNVTTPVATTQTSVSTAAVLNAAHGHTLVVHKFGGSSLASAERFHAVADIIQAQPQARSFVVVSAPGDTTDHLLELIAQVSLAQEGQNSDALQALANLQQRLHLLVQRTLTAPSAASVIATLDAWLSSVPSLIAQEQIADVLAIGEHLSALLLSALLRERHLHSTALDARQFLVLDCQPCEPEVLWSLSSDKLAALTQADITVVTGYIASDTQGRSITLGRNGSDYSATILGRLVGAQVINIWTDVDAIYSADPRKVPSATAYRHVPWSQAIRLAQLGNPVLHAKTLKPLLDYPAELVVRSSYEPEQSGCRVSRQPAIEVQFVTDLSDVVLLTLPKQCDMTAEQVAARLQCPVIAAPGSALVAPQWIVAQKNLESLLAFLGQQRIYPRVSSEHYQAVAWVKPAARQLRQLPLAASHWLERQQPAFSFSDDELAIWLFAPSLSARELTDLHQLLLPSAVRLNVVVAGTGNVGAEFLAMLAAQQQAFAPQIQLQLAGVLNSRQAAFAENIDATQWPQALASAPAYQKQELLDYLASLASPKVLIDITPSQTFAEDYIDFVATGCHLISANKKGVTLPLAQYQAITAAVAEQQVSWLSNTTVGAGLPVQRLLQELQSAGDRIHQISGIFSGTLSWLLCKFDGSQPFSEFVLEAHAQGLTEPDPRDDLSGKDVQRKLLVLSRELGLSLDIADIRLTPLLPAELSSGDWSSFWPQRGLLDDAMATLHAAAVAAGKVLRYVATLTVTEAGEVQAGVELRQVDACDPLAAILPCDNIFVIETDWYQQNPMVLKGPGAGRQVTAGGIHADLAIIARQAIAAAKAARHSQAQAAAWARQDE